MISNYEEYTRYNKQNKKQSKYKMNNDFNSWDKYCNYLWFDKQINIWLDISKINFTLDQISSLENKFITFFQH